MGQKSVLCKNKVTKPKEIEFSWESLLNTVKEIPEGYESAIQIGKKSGLAPNTVRARLAPLIAEGRVLIIRYKQTTYYKVK